MLAFTVFGFAVLSVVSASVDLIIHDCGSSAKINSINVEQCDAEPCHVTKGANYTVSVNFTATETNQQATNVLHGGIGFLRVPFPLEPVNACGASVPCPVVAGNTYLYTQTMTCPEYAPSISVTAIWALENENQKNIFCFGTKLIIQ